MFLFRFVFIMSMCYNETHYVENVFIVTVTRTTEFKHIIFIIHRIVHFLMLVLSSP